MKLWYLLGLIALVLLLLSVFFLSSVKASAAPAPTTWKETWGNLSNWTTYTTNCFSVVNSQAEGTCQSNSLISKKRWDPNKPITISGNVMGEPAQGSANGDYWAGLVLIADNGVGDKYISIATERHVPPWYDQTARIVRLNPKGKALATGKPGQTEVFKIDFQILPKRWSVSRNGGVLETVVQNPFNSGSYPIRAWLICVSVGENVGNNGSKAHCRFGPITVTGVPM